MCGICGIINFDHHQVERSSLEKMKAEIKHRGPDDDGMYLSNNIGFGFVRLSILDLSSAGHQPMQDDSERFTIVFNGEIYNYIELRDELQKRGYNFISETDTEVLLNAYAEWGQSCLNKLNGMFAFAVYDKKVNSVFIARDRFGIKPLYYYQSEDRFIFASEIQSILSVLNKSEIDSNHQSIFNYLAFNRTDQTTDTFFENIQKLQHGHLITIRGSNYEIRRWYDVSKNLKNPFNSPEEYRELFSSSVGLRLRSDVPVGVCLSGGLDSSSIVSTLLKDYNKNDLNTFSAIYGEGQTGDESEYIGLYKNQLSNMHYTTPTAETLFKDLDSFVNAQGEPVPSTAPYAQYKVMELAKEHVVVTLDGQGADEQLAGYHYFFGNYFKELLYHLKLLKLINEGFHYFKQHNSLFGLKTFVFFLLPNKLKSKVRVQEKGYIDDDFTEAYTIDNVIANMLYNSKSLQQSLLNHFEYKLEHLLKWEDRNSMNFSLESRVPFLDHRLVERTLSLSPNKIIKKGYTKQILRESMKGTLPEAIRMRQDKIGFSTPEDQWFREEKFQKLITNLIHSKEFKQRGIINTKKVQSLYQKHLAEEINISQEIWKWINLELWFREYID